MSARAVLEEMLMVLTDQLESVETGDTAALQAAAHRHESLLSALQTAEIDASPEELQALYVDIEHTKQKLRVLLESEANRVDFLLKLFLGGGRPQGENYSGLGGHQAGSSRLLNRRA